MVFSIDLILDKNRLLEESLKFDLKKVNREMLVQHLNWGKVVLKDSEKSDSFQATLLGFLNGLYGAINVINKGLVPKNISGVGIWNNYGDYNINIEKIERMFILEYAHSDFVFKVDENELMVIVKKNIKKIFKEIEEVSPDFLYNNDYCEFKKMFLRL